MDHATSQTLARFATNNLGSNQLAITLVDLHDPRRPMQASFRGNDQIYPASVVKLFYLVAVHKWLQEGRLQDRPELRRGMHDMIVDSLNEATGYLVDCLTGTTSGPELPPAELEQWYISATP